MLGIGLNYRKHAEEAGVWMFLFAVFFFPPFHLPSHSCFVNIGNTKEPL